MSDSKISGDGAQAESATATAETLFDPADFERRLVEARARRDQVLAAKAREKAPDPEPVETQHTSRTFRGRTTVMIAAIFLLGLGSGIATAIILLDRPETVSAPVPVVETAPDAPAIGADFAIASTPPALPSGKTTTGQTPATPAPITLPPPNLVATIAQDTTALNIYLPTGTTGTATLEALEAAGFSNLSSAPGRVQIGRTNIRYFHDADRAAAERVLVALNDPEATVRDFTHAGSRPAPGTLEIWLAGSAAKVTRSTRQERLNPAEVISGLVVSATQQAKKGVAGFEKILSGNGKLKTKKPKTSKNNP